MRDRRPGYDLPALPENRRSDSHVRRPERDGDREIGAHAHGEEREPVAARDLPPYAREARPYIIGLRYRHLLPVVDRRAAFVA